MAHYDKQREQHEAKNAAQQVGDTNVVELNDWYDYNQRKAIELPPVGCECEYTLSGNSWFKCSIVSQNKLVLLCPHIAEMDDNGNGLQVIHPETVHFRPLDWDRPRVPAEFNFHLANALNELRAASVLLSSQSDKSDLLLHAFRLILEAKGAQQ